MQKFQGVEAKRGPAPGSRGSWPDGWDGPLSAARVCVLLRDGLLSASRVCVLLSQSSKLKMRNNTSASQTLVRELKSLQLRK